MDGAFQLWTPGSGVLSSLSFKQVNIERIHRNRFKVNHIITTKSKMDADVRDSIL